MKKAIGVTVCVLVVSALAFAMIPATRDELHWRWATHKNEAASYESYIKTWAGGRHAAEAKAQYDELGWADAQAANTVQGLERYVQFHGDGKHVAKAKDSIESLHWQEATAINTIQGFKRYVQLHGDGKHIAEANNNIESLHRQEFEEALNAAAEERTYEAYHAVVVKYPDQDQLVMFEGGIGGFLDASIDMTMLCPVDRPRLEEIAAAQGVSMSNIRGFPGFHVGPPPMERKPAPMTLSFRETRNDCYAIPQWSGYDLGLYTEEVTKEGNKVSRVSTFSQNENKVFNFIGRKHGEKYRIVAAQLIRVLEKP